MNRELLRIEKRDVTAKRLFQENGNDVVVIQVVAMVIDKSAFAILV